MTLFPALGAAQAQRGASGGYAAPANDRGATGGYSAPSSDGGIFQSGYISDNAEFGNTFSAQNFQPCKTRVTKAKDSFGKPSALGGKAGPGQKASSF